jgi:N-acetylneuraminate epimerase
LEPDGTEWHEIARLPRALAYGGTVSLNDTVIFAGGQDETTVSRSVWALEKQRQSYHFSAWPDLPTPLTNFSMAVAGDRVYAFGGQSTKNSLASNDLWSLTVDAHGRPASNWRKEASLPAAGRILAAAAGCTGKLYLVGGAALTASENGVPNRHYLREAWSFDPVAGWKRLPDPPQASVAAPAACERNGDFMLIGGDNGQMAGVVLPPGEQHPGFSRNVMRYSVDQNIWAAGGELPIGLVTTGAAVRQDGRIVIPGGEDRPGSRLNQVLELSFDK